MNQELQPYQQRVVDERAQLDERRLKLQTFIDAAPGSDAHSVFENLSDADKTLLKVQLNIMGIYSSILAERIERFGLENVQ